MLELILDIRAKYFPNKLAVGYCITVCIFIASILKYEHGCKVSLVYGTLNNCLHTWLMVDNEQFDPSTDCTCVTDGRNFVTLVNSHEYIVTTIEEFEIRDFYPDTNPEQLKNLYKPSF